MREIKFRAWDKQTKRMAGVKSIEWRPTLKVMQVICVFSIEVSGLPDIEEFWVEPERLELLQYTGITDTHGKELYEGDIVRFVDVDDGRGIGEIRYAEELVTFDCLSLPLEGQRYHLGIHSNNFFEIIGNIYENPELLAPTHKEK